MRVAVIGAGIGGLTLALALHRRGVDVTVHERGDGRAVAGNGLGMAANGLRVLDELGIGSGLRRRGAPIAGMALRAADGEPLARYQLGPTGVIGIRRAEVVALLTDVLPDGTVRTGHECVDVELGARDATALFADGGRVTADVVVGADGLGSTVAGRIGSPPPLRDSGRVALRAFVTGTGLPPDLVSGQFAWIGPDRHLLTYPVDAGGTLVIAGFVPHAAAPAPGSDPGESVTALRAAFAGWNDEVGGLLGRATEVGRYGLFDRAPLPRWSRGHVCVLGDAAHPMLPHAGQGANQAVEDAAELAAILAARTTPAPAALPRALEAYGETRRERTARVQERSRVNGEMFSDLRAARSRPATDGDDLSWLYGYDATAAGRHAAAAARRR